MDDATILPTPEQIKRMGDRYQAPTNNREIKRAYSRNEPTVDRLYRIGSIDFDEYMAGCELRTAFYGMRCEPKISSYGDQRWVGTTDGQEAGTGIKAGANWRASCHQKVHGCNRAVSNARQWAVLVAVLGEDQSIEEAGIAAGVSANTAASDFKKALARITASDYCRWRPKAA